MPGNDKYFRFKKRKAEQLKKQSSSAIYEVTDEEAARLQKEIDDEKYV